MSDLPPQTTDGLVDELKQLLAVKGVGSFGSSTLLFRFADVADVARPHEAAWQADRARWQERERRLRELMTQLRGERQMAREEIAGAIGAILAPEQDAPTE